MEGNEREKIRHLLVVQDPKGQRTLPLLEATYSLGRDLRNAIVLYSRSVSRQHAILLRVTIPNTDQYVFTVKKLYKKIVTKDSSAKVLKGKIIITLRKHNDEEEWDKLNG